MAFIGRHKRDRPSNPTFEALGQTLGEIEDQISSMQNQMDDTSGAGSITMPTPQIPWVIAETVDNEGVMVNVATNIGSETQNLVIKVLKKNQNQKLSGETDAQALQRIKNNLKEYNFEVSDQERMSGVVERAIGPFKIKNQISTAESEKDKNRIQLIRLVAQVFNLKAKNPDTEPFGSTTFPIPTISINTTGAANEKYYEFGTATATVSPPANEASSAVGKIICNQVDSTTEAIDATVTFRIQASSANTGGVNDKTFEQMGITSVQAIIRRFGDTQAEPIKLGGVISDPTAKFVDVFGNFPIGKRYEWVRNVAEGGQGKLPPATPGSSVTFTSGFNSSLTGLSATLTSEAEDSRHVTLKLMVTQPASANVCQPSVVFYKRVRFEKRRTDGSWKVINVRRVLDENGAFTAGTTTTYTYEAKTKVNSLVEFRAVIVGIGNPQPESIITLDSSVINTDFDMPATPISGDIVENKPDDTTNEADATVVIRVWADPTKTKTFATTGADAAYIVVRKNSGTGDDTDDTRAPKYGGPIDPDDLGLTSTLITIRGLKLNKTYTIKRALLTREGSTKKSSTTNVSFVAGLNRTTAALTLNTPTISNTDERHSIINCNFVQPASGDPVPIKNIILLRKRPADAGFVELARKQLKDNPEFSVIGANNTVRFEVQHKRNPNGIQYQYTITAVGNSQSTSGTVTQGAATADLPTAPSAPATGLLFQEINTDTTTADARVIFRVYANAAQTNTFAQSQTDRITVVVKRVVDGLSSMEPLTVTAEVESTDTFVDLEMNLKLGKRYEWVRNVAANSSGNIKVMGSSVLFNAGGLQEDITQIAPTFSIVSNTPIDDRTAILTIRFVQPSNPVAIKRLDIYGKQSTGGTYKRVAMLRLLDIETLFSSAGTKDVEIEVRHPKFKIMNYYPELIGIGGTVRASTTHNSGSPYVADFANASDDIAAPSYAAGKTPKLRIKWKNNHLRVKFKLPTVNMNSFDRIILRFVIAGLIGGTTYTWHPDNGDNTTNGYTTGTVPDNQVYDSVYCYDAEMETLSVTEADRPIRLQDNQNGGRGVEFPTPAFNNLQNGSSVTVTVYVFNRFTGVGNAATSTNYTTTSGAIAYNPNNGGSWSNFVGS